MSGKPDYYAILGVFRDATQDEIKRAYFEAAQKLHPDKNSAEGETELFLEIQQAYETLSNPKRRSLYDATLPPALEQRPAVLLETLLSRSALVKGAEPQVIYLHLTISPNEGTNKIPSPPLNICLVLDRSTSMQGEKMDMLKATAIQLLRSLRPDDRLSIVAFSDRAQVVVPASLPFNLRQQENNIQMMQTSGGTEIYSGLKAGLEQINYGYSAGRVNHIILLTDGNTYGDELQCLELAEEAAQKNIGISGMGIGHEWNDIFLDALASKTGGSSAYIANPKDIQRLLVEKFNALVSMYADEVTLQYKEIEGIKINYAFRVQPDISPIDIESSLRLGPVLRDTPLQAILEFQVEPSALVSDKIQLLNGSLKLNIAARSTPVQPVRLNVQCAVSETPSDEAPPNRVLSALSRLTLYRMQERARLAADHGDFDAAARDLHNLATHLLSQGETSLAKTVLFEADNLEKKKNWSAGSSQKDIKYKTRALLLSGPKEKSS